MRTIDRYLPAPHGIDPGRLRGAPGLVLPFAERSKSRLRVTLGDGEEVAVFLPRGTVLRGGDLLVTAEGSFILVIAAAESVLEVRADDPLTLMRAAYHLGNRHIPVEVGRAYLRLEDDPVLADMLTRLGVHTERADLPFEPESGAYGGGHRHGHDATFAEDYATAQVSFKVHHGHVHDPWSHEHPANGPDHPHSNDRPHSHLHAPHEQDSHDPSHPDIHDPHEHPHAHPDDSHPHEHPRSHPDDSHIHEPHERPRSHPHAHPYDPSRDPHDREGS